MFNIQGSELIFLLLIALIVLGPEKLPDAIRKFGRAYAEFKKMANGFQGELRSALDEPMRELRDTADAMRAAVNFDEPDTASPNASPTAPTEPAPTPPPIVREPGLNFGSANPKRLARQAAGDTPAGNGEAAGSDTPPPIVREPGLNFGSANPRRQAHTPRDPNAPDPASPPDEQQPAHADAGDGEGDAAE